MLDKDTIEKEILLFLSKGKSGKTPEDLVGIIQCILKRLKIGINNMEMQSALAIFTVNPRRGASFAASKSERLQN